MTDQSYSAWFTKQNARRSDDDSAPIRIGRDLQRGDRTARRARCIRCGWEGVVIRIVFSRIIPPCKRCGYYTEALR